MEQEQNTRRPRFYRWAFAPATLIPTPLAPWATESCEIATNVRDSFAALVCDDLLQDGDTWERYLQNYRVAGEYCRRWSRIYDRSREYGLSMRDAFFTLPDSE